MIDYVVADQLAYEGSIGSDEAALRALVARIVDRTASMESSMTNHPPPDEGEPVRGRLDDIRAPTLVVHGTEDPLFPLAHGEALAAEIPGARLLALEGMGHQIPPARSGIASCPRSSSTRPASGLAGVLERKAEEREHASRVSRKNVNSTILPSSISSTWSAQGS